MFPVLDPRALNERRKALVNRMMGQYQQQQPNASWHIPPMSMRMGMGAGMPFRTSSSAAPRLPRISMTQQAQINPRALAGMGAAVGRPQFNEQSPFQGGAIDARSVQSPGDQYAQAAQPGGMPVGPGTVQPSPPGNVSAGSPGMISSNMGQPGSSLLPQSSPSVMPLPLSGSGTSNTIGGGAPSLGPISLGNGIFIDPQTGQLVSGPGASVGSASRSAGVYRL